MGTRRPAAILHVATLSCLIAGVLDLPGRGPFQDIVAVAAEPPDQAAAEDGLLTFADVSRQAGLLPAAERIQAHGAAWGDIDGDSWPDLYVGTFHYAGSGPGLLFRNQRGRLVEDQQPPVQISARATGIVFADFDNDADLDLYVASMPAAADSNLARRHGHLFRGCSLFRNDGSGQFTDVSADNGACPQQFGGRSAAAVDYDGDGLLDLLVGEDPLPGYNGSPTARCRLFRNLGELQFRDESAAAGLPAVPGFGVAAADVNLDTWPDLFIACTTGNYLLLNDGQGRFAQASASAEVFAWPQAGDDDMVCGVAIADVNRDRWPEIVIGQHFSHPWTDPVSNRLYLNSGLRNGQPQFRDVTQQAGLVPIPMKAPQVDLQDFDNDGWTDLVTSVVTFADGQPQPLIFRNLGRAGSVPAFRQTALQANDFPTDQDRRLVRSKAFFERMLQQRKIFYAAPGPVCDFDRDGRLDLFLGSWWQEADSLLLRNLSSAGNWIDVSVQGTGPMNWMGVGTRVEVYSAGHADQPSSLLGCREIVVGAGYASSTVAEAHFGLGTVSACDLVAILPHDRGRIVRQNVSANQRVTVEVR